MKQLFVIVFLLTTCIGCSEQQEECRKELTHIEKAVNDAKVWQPQSITIDMHGADKLIYLNPYCDVSNLPLSWYMKRQLRDLSWRSIEKPVFVWANRYRIIYYGELSDRTSLSPECMPMVATAQHNQVIFRFSKCSFQGFRSTTVIKECKAKTLIKFICPQYAILKFRIVLPTPSREVDSANVSGTFLLTDSTGKVIYNEKFQTSPEDWLRSRNIIALTSFFLTPLSKKKFELFPFCPVLIPGEEYFATVTFDRKTGQTFSIVILELE